jgi:hypothetical protein
MTIAVATRSSRDVEIEDRVDAIDLGSASAQLDAYGWAMIEKMLSAEECRALADLYGDDRRFRSHVVMARHGFGRGEYKYFDDPLPDIVAALRTSLYSRLAPLANRWNERLGIEVRYPEEHAGFLARCHEADQKRPTPLLQYGAGDYDCLHQDLYGEHVFPFQVAFLLAEPEKDPVHAKMAMGSFKGRCHERKSRPLAVSGCCGDRRALACDHLWGLGLVSRPVL